jgi:hypothetical protein
MQIAARRDFSEDSMKRVFLLIVVPALLVAMGLAQTPAAGGNTDQINIKGCLGGSDGNYNIAEDNTGKILRITSSSADLKAYQGQDVILIGHKAGTADSGLAVTEVKMVTEHCAAVAAAPAGAVSAPADTTRTPPDTDTGPATNAPPAATSSAPAETVSTPAATSAAAPDATLSMSSENVSTAPDIVIERPTPAPPATAPAAVAPAISTPVENASAPAAATAVHRTRSSARPPKPAASPAAIAPAATVSKPAPVAAASAARVDSPSEAADAPAQAAPVAAAPKPASSRSILMIVAIVMVVLLIGAGVPLYNRGRRRKLAAQAGGENLSFTHKTTSDLGNRDTTGGRKAA